ncbi:MAG: prolipoprotein diacylglyceryl transferase [Syntrophaceae bacterium]|nr:prolipoprotein diacylglyceryl transferase [Syntrophaceae bacterium]
MAILFSWAFRTLPGERWQVLACFPTTKRSDGIWRGVNLTYYGFFNAFAYLFAVIMFLIMMGSINIKMIAAICLIIPFLTICMLASRLIARWVEKKLHTFSVGGASFFGILIGPWIICFVNTTLGKWFEFRMPMLETLTAIFIAYAFGEGIGRLGCISFGCCYGKPLDACHPLIRRIFKTWNFTFRGKTKKIAYAQKLEGQAVVPVQALTAVVYTGTGILCFYLFLQGFTKTALIITLVVTQGWRFASEFLRADHRGKGFISVYQTMTLFAIGYTLLIVPFIKESHAGLPNLLTGIIALWDPGIIVFLISLWIISFIYSGKSSVTCSSIDIQIIEDNI